ncbi:hypothetical protein EDD16DRAFT_1636907 [Pisolithus croceorrhizus]|nr:hypothetical protein EDD16DRAFT_1636907 [Pisolithus croceorrhizus]
MPACYTNGCFSPPHLMFPRHPNSCLSTYNMKEGFPGNYSLIVVVDCWAMGKFSIVQYFREQWKALPTCSGDVGSKAIMVVGSSAGIGLEVSVHLVYMKPGHYS